MIKANEIVSNNNYIIFQTRNWEGGENDKKKEKVLIESAPAKEDKVGEQYTTEMTSWTSTGRTLITSRSVCFTSSIMTTEMTLSEWLVTSGV